jgi:transcriptional regulator with XRE-family HTH domain
MLITMSKASLPAEEVRRVRKHLNETQVEFARRLDVDPVTVARWETGQRRCIGLYALAIARLAPEPVRDARGSAKAAGDEAKLSALTHLVRAFFDGSTTRAVTALLSRERLSDREWGDLAQLIEEKRKKEKKEKERR